MAGTHFAQVFDLIFWRRLAAILNLPGNTAREINAIVYIQLVNLFELLSV